MQVPLTHLGGINKWFHRSLKKANISMSTDTRSSSTRQVYAVLKHNYYEGVRDAIHTHFVTLISKRTISFLPTYPVFLPALSRDVTKLLYFDLVTLPLLSVQCLTHPPTIVHLPISVTKWVWMASLTFCLSRGFIVILDPSKKYLTENLNDYRNLYNLNFSR